MCFRRRPDGLFTAIVSGPVPVMPSQWLPAVWGDFEPVWEDEKALQEILSLADQEREDVIVTLTDTLERSRKF